MAIEGLLIHTAYLLKRGYASTPDRHGQRVISFSPESSTFKCRIHPQTRQNRLLGEGDTSEIHSTHVLYCFATVPIEARDRVSSAGRKYEVSFVANESGLDHHFKADLLEIKA